MLHSVSSFCEHQRLGLLEGVPILKGHGIVPIQDRVLVGGRLPPTRAFPSCSSCGPNAAVAVSF